ncbi:hypothetical protein [Paracoccus haematequi]|uniref:hypothetical protein n=1 Tax=Paracoccus haematequi TaxID=2491866 RepID=UPI000F7F6DE6|nr:hypothetical protein [Paracoccus haematequi]
MRVVQIVVLIALATFLACLSVCRPEVLSRNSFLDGFVNHEYVNIISVMVTVNLVTIIQIFLEYSRIERRFKIKVFSDARRKLSISALMLIGCIVASFFIAIFRSSIENSLMSNAIRSGLHSSALLTILVCVLVMYDLIRVVYVLANEEPVDGPSD